MSTEQCERLLDAYRYARAREQTGVIVLSGGDDFFSNGIHLNVIQAAADPAQESWRNLNAIDDLVAEIIQTDSHLVISALGGDAAAGGVPLALAADLVLARNDVVLNPYYQHMGGLYGSEYWTYLLPRRVGAEMTRRLTSAPFTPVGAREAVRIGLLDDAFGAGLASFQTGTRVLAERLARDSGLPRRLGHKRARLARDQQHRPLAAYRDQELARCHDCCFGPDPSYHHARARFVYKLGTASTPHHTADAARRGREEGCRARRALSTLRTAQAPGRDVLVGIGPQSGSADDAAARVRAATRHFEEHVIAWHALGRLQRRRGPRATTCAHHRQQLGAELRRPANPPIGHSSAATSRQGADGARSPDAPSDGTPWLPTHCRRAGASRLGSRVDSDVADRGRRRGRRRNRAFVTLRLDLGTATIGRDAPRRAGK